MNLSRRRLLALMGASAAASATFADFGATSVLASTEFSSRGRFDLVIMGATPSGIMTALAFLRQCPDATVAIINNTLHVGGMMMSGIGVINAQFPQSIGGLSAQFYRDVAAYYDKPVGTDLENWITWEPHVAEKIFGGYLDSKQITVILGRAITAVGKVGTRIDHISLDDHSLVYGTQFVDATYEGDLMAMSGASYTVGRESMATYGEPLAGFGQLREAPISPFLYPDSEELIEMVRPYGSSEPGSADSRVQAYTYCICMSTAPDRIPFPQPMNYDPADFVGVLRTIEALDLTWHQKLWSSSPTPNQTRCVDNANYISIDCPGMGNWGYPDASPATRELIEQEHANWVKGFFYFLSNDSAVRPSIRADMSLYGLAPGEFKDNDNWPYQLYIREGRRLVGPRVMTQGDILHGAWKRDAIGMGQWEIDCHICTWIAGPNNDLLFEGGLENIVTPPWQLPFSAIQPDPSQVSNLQVSVCMSMSHVAWAAGRTDATSMIAGEAAGTAAGLAVTDGVDVASVSVPAIQAKLLAGGSIFSL